MTMTTVSKPQAWELSKCVKPDPARVKEKCSQKDPALLPPTECNFY